LLEKALGAEDVVPQIAPEAVAPAGPDACLGGEVQHRVHLLQDGPQVRLAQVLLQEREPGLAPQTFKVRLFDLPRVVGVEVVDADDFPSLGEEPLRRMAADEAGAASDEALQRRTYRLLSHKLCQE